MGYKPSLADPDIWMRDNGRCYDWVCLYVDDLTAIMEYPKAFFEELERRGFGLKGVTSEPDVFLGRSFGRDPDGTLYWVRDASKPTNVPLVKSLKCVRSPCRNAYSQSWILQVS
jgi:hypothetical protein